MGNKGRVLLVTPGVAQGHGVTVTQDIDQELCGKTRGHGDTDMSRESAASRGGHQACNYVIWIEIKSFHRYLVL